jgi:hypothetical protein
MDVHTRFLMVNRQDDPYRDTDRRALRAISKAQSPPSAPVADGVGCVQVPDGVTTCRQVEQSALVQNLLQTRKNKRAVAAAATRAFDAMQKGDTIRSIPGNLKLGKNALTMKELGLEGWLGVEFYELGPDSGPFPCASGEPEHPIFLGLNLRTVADGYSPADKKVYVFGRGLTAALAAYDAHISRLQSQWAKATNEEQKQEINAEMIAIRTAKENKRRRFYQSAARFLSGVFDYITLSDLSANAIKKQPDTSKKVKRDFGTVAIEDFRRFVCAAAAAITPAMRAQCVAKLVEDNSTKTLQCCKFGSPCVRGSKTVICVFGCRHQDGQAASQDRDGGAGRNQACYAYTIPSDSVFWYMYDQIKTNHVHALEVLENVEANIMAHDEELLKKLRQYDKKCPKHKCKVAKAKAILGKVLAHQYEEALTKRCFHIFMKRPAPGGSGGFSGCGT